MAPRSRPLIYSPAGRDSTKADPDVPMYSLGRGTNDFIESDVDQ